MTRAFVTVIACVVAGASVVLGTEFPPPPNPELGDVRKLFLTVDSRCVFKAFDGALDVIRPDVVRKLLRARIAVLDEAFDASASAEAGSLSIIVHCAEFHRNGSAVELRTYVPSGEEDLPRGPFVFHMTAEFSKDVALSPVKGVPRRVGMVVWSHPWSDLGILPRRPFVTLRDQILEVVERFVTEVERARTLRNTAATGTR